MRTPWFSKMKAGREGWAGGRIEITIVGDRLLEYAGYVSLAQVHSGARSNDDAKGDVAACLGAVLHSEFGARSEFALDFGLVIDQEWDGVHGLVLPHRTENSRSSTKPFASTTIVCPGSVAS